MLGQMFLLLALLLQTWNVHAHKPSDSYLKLSINDAVISGQWDIALRDLDFAIGLDADGDAGITWGEVKAKHEEIATYALSRLTLASDGSVCAPLVKAHLIDDHTDGAYAVLKFEATCGRAIETLQARYALFFDVDPQHKGLLHLEYQGQSRTGVFTPEQSRQEFTLDRPGKLGQFADYFREGVWHIWIGFDHILFLLALLLPSVAMRVKDAWQAAEGIKSVFLNVLGIVTAFTIAHSITLSLATLGIVNLPSRWVESTIAASVVIAALNNVMPIFSERRWIMAFLFGLIHGFGFASVLADLGLPGHALVLALVGFNVGVEAGQLAIVAAFLPLAFTLRRTVFYRRIVLQAGSLAIAMLAAIWLIERLFDLELLSF
ncbi:HupE/UreJ family protein [Noviherbaspirillum aerium]|uniref:HupE/UreJ family protein n=1 Tax=Noviherbaspirillum aerium TaxID=2588497 RepID=UPI00124C2F2B|nr:HupE/UreJ family protein [Noviherbaspirillum aerium]